MGKLSLMITQKDCMGCNACEVACKQEHRLRVGPRLIRIIDEVPRFRPVYCRHCAKAPCGEACPVRAISRNEQGIVLIDGDICIGCRACLDACPFEAMQFDDHQEIAVKCDLCVERLAEDKEPACVSVCPTRCMQVGGRKSSTAAVFERPA